MIDRWIKSAYKIHRQLDGQIKQKINKHER